MRLLEYEGCFAVILELFTFSCYNLIALKGNTTFTSIFVSKPQSHLECRAEPSITY